MTEAEIMKALVQRALPSEINCIHGRYEEACGIYCTKKRQNAEYCHDCKEHSLDYYGRLSKSIFDLLNRKNAKIEKVRTELDRLTIYFDEAVEAKLKTARAEAIKDFAEKVQAEFEHECVRSRIWQIAKEMGVEL